jgi:hypothetical protein
MSSMARWHKLTQLSWPDRWFLVQAAALLPVLSLALRLAGLRRVQAALERLAPHPGPQEGVDPLAEERVRSRARLIRAAATHGWYRANCLPQSVLYWWLLRRRGVDAELRIGVRKEAGGMVAHAWVEYRGLPLNDRAEVHMKFRPFSQAIGSGVARAS